MQCRRQNSPCSSTTTGPNYSTRTAGIPLRGTITENYTVSPHPDEADPPVALFGFNLNPNSRPILRGALGMLVRALQMINIPWVEIAIEVADGRLVVLYWLTRRTFTGLPIATLTFETISDLIYCIGTRTIARIHRWDRGMSLASGLAAAAYIALAANQLYLRYRPKFATKVIAESGLRVPTAVRFRRPNVAEQNTLNANRKFDWRLRLAVSC